MSFLDRKEVGYAILTLRVMDTEIRRQKVTDVRYCMARELVKFVCKGLDSKHFGICRPRDLSRNYSALPAQCRNGHR